MSFVSIRGLAPSFTFLCFVQKHPTRIDTRDLSCSTNHDIPRLRQGSFLYGSAFGGSGQLAQVASTVLVSFATITTMI